MKDERKQELFPCRIKACGARVIQAAVDGRMLQLDPVTSVVAVPREDGTFDLVQGYPPHAYTCVDIAGRRSIREDDPIIRS